MRWLSVPPDTMRKPSAASASASAAALRTICGGVVAELGLQRLLERDRLGRDHVHERAALQPGEHRLVDGRRVLLAAHDRARARTAERLVRGES